jgi:hypothetical protein
MPSVDRINPERPHVVDNLQIVCLMVNRAMSAFRCAVEEFWEFVRLVVARIEDPELLTGVPIRRLHLP